MLESFPPNKTTVIDGTDTVNPGTQALCWALVLAWSSWEPHRVGQVAFIPTFESRLFGRGDSEVEKFTLFAKQLPGEPYAPTAAFPSRAAPARASSALYAKPSPS